MAKKQFKAESKRLLDLMINSIYTHKEIFLREIISNASDACDKLCYQALTDDSVKLTRKDFKIDLSVNKDARTITVTDNGIGMDKEDLENNLGVIASSGSYKFKQEVGDDTKDTDVIGQFGVGFYSAFMVCDQVTVRTRKFGSDTAYQWQSSGADGYTVTECDKSDAGTEVIMHLKDDTEDEHYSEFLEEWKLRELIKKYSDYIRFPIRMAVTKTKKVASCMSDKPDEVPYVEMETLNSMVPIWQRKKADVKPEEYNEFYREKFHDFADPQRVITVSAEGAVTYKALLFIPGATPFDFYTKEYEKGLQLYSSGVLIMDKCPDLLPEPSFFRERGIPALVQNFGVGYEPYWRYMGAFEWDYNGRCHAEKSFVALSGMAHAAALPHPAVREAFDRLVRASVRRGRIHRGAHPGDRAAERAARRRDLGALLRAARGAGRGRLRRRQLRPGETGRRPAATDHRAVRRRVHGRIGEAAQSGQNGASARTRSRLPHGAHDQQARHRPRARRIRRRPGRRVLRQLHRRGEDLVRRVRDLLERREDLQQPAAAQHSVHP